jgi:ferric-dicitrate binding protein FerR (iron transport regulator)
MPYKDPERKRQWEREHRKERNARRRRQHLTMQIRAMLPKAAVDTTSNQQPKSKWKSIAALVVGLGVVLLTALAGVPVYGNLGSSNFSPKGP